MKNIICDIDKEFAKHLLKKFKKLKQSKDVDKVLEMLSLVVQDKYDEKLIKEGLKILSKHYEDFWK